MEKNDIKAALRNLPDSDLAEVAQHAAAESQRRAPKLYLEDIKPGMSAEKRAEVWAAITAGIGR